MCSEREREKHKRMAGNMLETWELDGSVVLKQSFVQKRLNSKFFTGFEATHFLSLKHCDFTASYYLLSFSLSFNVWSQIQQKMVHIKMPHLVDVYLNILTKKNSCAQVHLVTYNITFMDGALNLQRSYSTQEIGGNQIQYKKVSSISLDQVPFTDIETPPLKG